MPYLRSTAPGGDKDEACAQAGVARVAERVKLVRSAPSRILFGDRKQ